MHKYIIRGQRTHMGLGTLIISSFPTYTEKGKEMQTWHYFIEPWITSQRMPLLFYCLLQQISLSPLIRSWRLLCIKYLKRNAVMQSTFLLNSVKLATSA